LKESREYFNSLAIGAAQQNISKSVVEDCPVVIPSLAVFNAFNQLVGPMFAMIETLTLQNTNLASLRDSLLPRLISGELDIPEELLVD
jgi:type I restriction enzyme S subunit